jgi:hypothetical protein
MDKTVLNFVGFLIIIIAIWAVAVYHLWKS